MDNNIWNYTVKELAEGCAETETEFVCPLCGTAYEKGRIYDMEGTLYDAGGARRRHMRVLHGSTADFLLAQSGSLTGLSQVQTELLLLISAGKTDREISAAMGIAPSTVRNHRFKLREKEKQARLFLALMQSLQEKSRGLIAGSDAGELAEVHAGASMVDERYCITEQEQAKVIKTYMDENGAIRQFPSKEKKKIILMKEVMKNFKRDVKYSEAEVNRILKRIYEEDYPTLRRALIEYGFMDRSDDCSVYRVKM